MGRNRLVLFFGIICTILSFQNCSGSFHMLSGSDSSDSTNSQGSSTPTPSPSPTPSPTPLPQACESLDPMSTPTVFGPRWNSTAYGFWSTQLDSSLQRSDYVNDPTGTLSLTRSFQMPFLANQSPAGCATFNAQVLFPNPNLNKVTQSVSCPTTPYTDVTATVATAINALATAQANDAANGVQDSLELDFQTPCTYYFISSGAPTFINVPNVTDLTISGGTSLSDAATLIFANPTPLTPSSFSSSVYLMTAQSTGPNSTPQNAFSILSGGQRIKITNFKMQGLTPPVINGVTQWNLTIPYVDFGTLSADPNNPGQNIMTVPSNNPNQQVIFNTFLRQGVQTDPSSPQDILTTAPGNEMGNITNPTYSGTGQALVISSSTFAKFPTGPYKLIHTSNGNGASFAFQFNEPANNTPINDISLVNIDLTDWNGISLAVVMSKGLLLENFHITPSGTAHRTVTGGGLIVGQLASDLIVENSEFSYGGDDDINLRSDLRNITSTPTFDGTNTNFTISGNLNLQVGTPLCFLSPAFDILLCTPVVSLNSANKALTLSVAGNQTLTLPNGQTTLQNGDLFFRADKPNLRSYIVSNLFQGNRARGILMKGSDSYIANNQFLGTQGPGVGIIPENATYTEGPLPRNIVVSGNTLNNNENGLAYGAIGVGLSVAHLPANSQGIQNILIENNNAGQQISPAVFTASSGYVDVRGNTYGTINLNTYYATSSFWTSVGTGFTLAPICSLDP